LPRPRPSDAVPNLLAGFDSQMAREHSFGSQVWAEPYHRADHVVADANEAIRNECAKLGNPPQFARRIGSSWARCGENIVRERRADLRPLARASADEILKSAPERIERPQALFRQVKRAARRGGRHSSEDVDTIDRAARQIVVLLTGEDVSGGA
jgi:hypothetical protein